MRAVCGLSEDVGMYRSEGGVDVKNEMQSHVPLDASCPKLTGGSSEERQ